MFEWAKSKLKQGVASTKQGIKDLDKATLAPRQKSINTDRRKFDSNKYKIDQFTYPMDLMAPQYGGNYAIFYINVSDDSRLNVK